MIQDDMVLEHKSRPKSQKSILCSKEEHSLFTYTQKTPSESFDFFEP